MDKKPKRPKDINKLARFIIEIATGEKMPKKKKTKIKKSRSKK